MFVEGEWIQNRTLRSRYVQIYQESQLYHKAIFGPKYLGDVHMNWSSYLIAIFMNEVLYSLVFP